MPNKIDLLRRVYADICQIKPNLDNLSDDVFLDVAAYHLQQAVEKLVKYVMSQNNVIFNKTHDILELCQQMDDNSISYPDWVYNNAKILTNYATKVRFGEDLVGNRRKIEELLELVTEYYEQNKQQQDMQKQRG